MGLSVWEVIKMQNYKDLYIHLFGAVSDAIDELEKMNLGNAKQILIHAQQESEETYLKIGEK